MSRDIIDLAVLADADGSLDATGVAKALHAYGPSVLVDVKKARAQLLDRKGRLRDCMKSLCMSMPEAELRRRIQAIRPSSTSV